MGDPKKHRRKYQKPFHPWQKTRIDDEKGIVEEYGLKNKRELWKMQSKLKRYTGLAKKLVIGADKEHTALLVNSLHKLGLVKGEAQLDNVLGLQLRDIMERRLQTIVFRKGLGRTINQARQFITHGHILVGERPVTAPSYLVSAEEEQRIGFSLSSSLSNSEHPERAVEVKK